MPPTVSVVLCGYNQAEYLDVAIRSVLDQTYPALELLIVDNGSTDTSHAVAKAYQADARVRLLLHTDNAAVTVRLNEAIRMSSGEYISILYADDYYLPRKLEKQVEAFAMLAADYGVVYSPGYRLEGETGRQWIENTLKVSGFILKDMLVGQRQGFVNPISPLLRRQCFIDFPFYEDLFIEGELIFWRIALKYRFFYLDEPLSVMREHMGNRGKALKLNVENVRTLLARLASAPQFPALHSELRKFRGDFMALCGWLGIRVAADGAWARQCFLEAIRSTPMKLMEPRTAAGLLLSSCPLPVLRGVNTMLNRARDHKETIVFKEDYS